ncbi:MAG: FecR domain-containing protein [Marinifilum sp.]|jgi:ferric-dicitrate binding protein FerR (iron transport regulator)|nr:FecR domain-containing protein [Marinifilum sp.]
MDNFYENNNFLARWVDGTLSGEEKKAFENSKNFHDFQAILKGCEHLKVPDYNKDEMFVRLLERKEKAKTKTRKLVSAWTFSAAASVALIISFIFLFNQKTKHATDYGQQLAFKLPDQSEVILNAKSKLNYEKKNWENNRTVQLEGEAFFKVNKGSTFTVKTKNGSVTVLGTQFTTNASASVFEVVCYEGKVRVNQQEKNKIITKGEAVRSIDNQLEKWNLTRSEPAWLKGESGFSNAPLEQVIKALENQYNIKIQYDNALIASRRYTGTFTHSNMEIALKLVFDTLKIKYNFVDDRTIRLH